MSSVILPPALPQHSVSLRTPKVARQTWGGVSSELAGHRTSHDTDWSYITGPGRSPQTALGLRHSGNPPLLGLGYTPGSPRCPGEEAVAPLTAPPPARPPTGLSACPALTSISHQRMFRWKRPFNGGRRRHPSRLHQITPLGRIGSSPERGQGCPRSWGGRLCPPCALSPTGGRPTCRWPTKLTCQN